MEDERFWACPACDYVEFDLDEVKVIKRTARRALIEQGNRVHNLRYLTWPQLVHCRRLSDENWFPNTHNLYVKPKRVREFDKLLAERDARRETEGKV